ncbi:MAG: alpha/beta fold hydrolase [Candidatus Omnitrophota bacterium]
MKKFYITVITGILLIMATLVGAFLLIDRMRRDMLSYVINVNGLRSGFSFVDRFATEDSIVHRSSSGGLLDDAESERSAKLILDKTGSFRSYVEQTTRDRATESIYLENKRDGLSFLSVYGAKFSLLEKIPTRNDAIPFNDKVVMTYLPFIKQYDFRIGGPQAFPALRQFSTRYPPINTLLTLRSIRDEYVAIEGRKIKTECVLLRTGNMPQITLWISKLDHSLVKVDIPDKNIVYARTFIKKKELAGTILRATNEALPTMVFFQNKTSGIKLAGYLSTPAVSGGSPAVLLVDGPSPYEPDRAGLFSSITSYLTDHGFCVFRFDRRGVGRSGGDLASYSLKDEISDIGSALGFLAEQPTVDKDNIALLGHSWGGYYALKAASEYKNVRGCMVLAMPFYDRYLEALRDEIRHTARSLRWNDSYTANAERSVDETYDIVRKSNVNWSILLRKKCFLGRMREEMNDKPPETIAASLFPILILQGNLDTAVPAERAKVFDAYLKNIGNDDRRLVYFAYLGHFFGKRTFGGRGGSRFNTDPHVLVTIGEWLRSNIRKKAEEKTD